MNCDRTPDLFPDRCPDHAVTRAVDPGHALTGAVDPDACRCLCHSSRGKVFHFAPCCRPCEGCGERIRSGRVAAHADRLLRLVTR